MHFCRRVHTHVCAYTQIDSGILSQLRRLSNKTSPVASITSCSSCWAGIVLDIQLLKFAGQRGRPCMCAAVGLACSPDLCWQCCCCGWHGASCCACMRGCAGHCTSCRCGWNGRLHASCTAAAGRKLWAGCFLLA